MIPGGRTDAIANSEKSVKPKATPPEVSGTPDSPPAAPSLTTFNANDAVSANDADTATDDVPKNPPVNEPVKDVVPVKSPINVPVNAPVPSPSNSPLKELVNEPVLPAPALPLGP